MASPYFTIIIPTYNRATFIRRTVESVLKQEDTDLEVIVVDDGSTDNTEEVVASLVDDRIVYLRKENGERAKARNFGVKASRGTYVTFLDSDDLLYPDHLRTAREKIKALQYPAVYHQGYEVINEGRRVLFRQTIRGSLNELLFTHGNVMSCMGVFLKDQVAKVNLFNETLALTGLEDWELWIRLAAQYPISYDNKITSALIQHEQRSVRHMNELELSGRIDTFFQAVESNDLVLQKYGKLFSALRGNMATYMSLHLSELPGHKRKSFKALLRGIRNHPGVIFRRRTLSILRNIILR